MNEIPTISTGESSTLKTYWQIAFIMSGGDEQSPAVQLIQKKIDEQGEDAVVIQDERQMLYLFAKLNEEWMKGGK